MAENLQAFVESIKQNIRPGRQETMAELRAPLRCWGERLSAVFKQLEHGQQQMDQTTRAAHRLTCIKAPVTGGRS